MKTCKIDGCERRVKSWGMCNMHYLRWHRLGSATSNVQFKAPVADVRAFYERAIRWKDRRKCLTWPFARGDGYGRITLNGKRELVHRAICRAVWGDPEDLAQTEVAHNCGNGHLSCVNPWHLRWDTHAGNLADTIRHGTSTRGEDNSQAKLTETNVRYIRKHRRNGATYDALARHYKVSTAAIRKVVKRKSWYWLD